MAKNRRIQDQFMLLCPESLLGRFGTTLGSILEPFGVIWSSFLVFFPSFSVIFPICVKGALMFAVSTGRLCFYERKCGRERKRGRERNKRKRFSSIGSSFGLLW